MLDRIALRPIFLGNLVKDGIFSRFDFDFKVGKKTNSDTGTRFLVPSL